MGSEANKQIDKINPPATSVWHEDTVLLPPSSLEDCDSPPPLYDLIDNLSSELTILTPPETAMMTEPEMCLTTEEINFLAELKSKHSSACKRSFPLR